VLKQLTQEQTMKTFRFRAKQGANQANRICKIMTHVLQIKPRVRKMDYGCLITADLPNGVSKRSVDRVLYAHKIPGAVPKENKYPIIKGDKYDVMYDDRSSDWFTWVCDGKFMGVYRQTYFDYGCECCGGYMTLESKKGEIL
jgi:hypothetical protein